MRTSVPSSGDGFDAELSNDFFSDGAPVFVAEGDVAAIMPKFN